MKDLPSISQALANAEKLPDSPVELTADERERFNAERLEKYRTLWNQLSESERGELLKALGDSGHEQIAVELTGI